MPRDPIKSLEYLEKHLESRVAGVLLKHAQRIVDKLHADQPLKQRGSNRFPYRCKLVIDQGLLSAIIFSPVSWLSTHVGPRGSSTTITPKRGRFLALPTEFVKKFRQHPVGPRQYGGTFIHDGVIFGKIGWGRKAFNRSQFTQRRAAGEVLRKEGIVPLYILKGSVVIRRRIHPDELVRWVKPGFLADYNKVLKLP